MGGHNLSSDVSAGFTLPSSHNSVDPLLGPLADNGGLTPTMALLPSSPAIDAGDSSACLPMDQRGVARPMGVACDIGAFELAPKLTLTRSSERFVSLNYVFRAGETNSISTSTNLSGWVPLGTAVSDMNGVLQFEHEIPAQAPSSFYRVQSAQRLPMR
jgi:hypothetical protein